MAFLDVVVVVLGLSSSPSSPPILSLSLSVAASSLTRLLPDGAQPCSIQTRRSAMDRPLLRVCEQRGPAYRCCFAFTLSRLASLTLVAVCRNALFSCIRVFDFTHTHTHRNTERESKGSWLRGLASRRQTGKVTAVVSPIAASVRALSPLLLTAASRRRCEAVGCIFRPL